MLHRTFFFNVNARIMQILVMRSWCMARADRADLLNTRLHPHFEEYYVIFRKGRSGPINMVHLSRMRHAYAMLRTCLQHGLCRINQLKSCNDGVRKLVACSKAVKCKSALGRTFDLADFSSWHDVSMVTIFWICLNGTFLTFLC